MEGNIRKGLESFARLRVGRVVELRVRRLADPDDVDRLHSEVLAAIRRIGEGAVICGDYRYASPFSHAVARAWSRAMREANRGIVRSGLLLDPGNTMFNLQIERVVRCATNPARRFFASSEGLCDWAGSALSELEQKALRELFADDGG